MISFCLFLNLSWAQQNDVSIYSVEDGLAQSQVFAMMEDPKGHLWLGTQGGGISQFDGIKFKTYTTRDGLLSNYVSSFFYDKDNYLWIGTNVGLSRFDGNKFRSFFPSGQQPLEIRGIIQPAPDRLWLGTNRGVFTLIGDSLYPINERLGRLHVHCLIQHPEEGIWIGHQGGMMQIIDQDTLLFNPRNGLPASGVSDVFKDSKDRIWIATRGNGLYQKVGPKAIPVDLGNLPPDMLIWDIEEDKDGRLWFGTLKQGAISWSPEDSSIQVLNDQNGLLKNHVHTIHEDEWGTIWLGTSGGGLSRFAGQQFFHFGRNSELRGQSVYAMTVARDSSLWFSVGNKGLGRYNGRFFRFFNGDNGFRNVTVRSLYTDKKGRIWAGTDGEGIYIIKDTLQDVLDFADGIANPWIKDFVEDNDGYMWVATSGGIARIFPYQQEEGIWQYDVRMFQMEDGLASNRVNCLHKDLEGRIWFGLDGQGIGFIEKGYLVRRVPQSSERSRKIIRCIKEDTHGHLWVGTGGGVSRLSIYEPLGAPDWVHYSDKLTSSNTYLLMLDGSDNLWIGSEKGLDEAQLDDYQFIIDVRHYGIAEGFTGVETCRNAAIRDYKGNFWFGTIGGLTRYNPRRNTENLIPPKLSIKGINLFYSSLYNTKFAKWMAPWNELRPGLRLPHNRNHLSFEFTGINYPNPEQVTYQWILEGYETEWSPVSAKTDATYANIPPGDYTFKVKASNEDHVWSNPLGIPFYVKPPYWQEWWFVLAWVAFIGIVIMLLLRARINRIQRKARQERERLIMEKSVIELEQKALRLQMNPHFIFHALNSINGLITEEDTQTARYYLSKFSHLMRQVLENSREGFIPLQAEIDTLENYLTLERFSREKIFDFAIELANDLDPEEFLIPPMIIQPFVENAIIHGVGNLKGRKGQVKICFQEISDSILCTITDDGIGRQEAERLKHKRQENKKSTALLVTQERLDLLQSESLQQPSITIEDLLDNRGLPKGTKIQVRIPYLTH
ncbi:MAG: two-component regulator propeller domain-containing protein [Bacteroidota bacterium]